jgi:hypothetical protein
MIYKWLSQQVRKEPVLTGMPGAVSADSWQVLAKIVLLKNRRPAVG